MGWQSYGRVVVPNAGTPVHVSLEMLGCQTVFFQQVPGNTGYIYILDGPNGDKDTKVLAVLSVPSYNISNKATFLPSCGVTIPTQPNALNLADFWIDVEVSGESVRVSPVRSFNDRK
jgi:hypothetical protein